MVRVTNFSSMVMENYKDGWFRFFFLFHFVLCTVFGWDRFHFLHVSSCGAVFWICDHAGVGHADVLVVAEQCSPSVGAPPASGLGMHEKLGGTQLGQLDLCAVFQTKFFLIIQKCFLGKEFQCFCKAEAERCSPSLVTQKPINTYCFH